MESRESRMKAFFVKFSDDLEQDDPNDFSERRGESKIIVYFLLVFAFWQVLLMETQYSLLENVINVILATLAFSPVLLMATKPFDDHFKQTIKKTYGLDVIFFFIGFYSLYFLVGSLLRFQMTATYMASLESLIVDQNFILNFVILMASVYFFFRFPFYLLEFRDELKPPLHVFKEWKQHLELWIHFGITCILGVLVFYGLVKESLGSAGWLVGLSIIPLFFVILIIAQVPGLKYNVNHEDEERHQEEVFTVSDLFCMLFLAPAILFLYMLPFAGSWGVFLFLILLIHGTGIRREHFYYSYSPQSSKDVFEYVDMILISFLIFIPLGILVSFIDINDFTLDISFPELYGAICSWAFYVGISEEVIFRVGILILFSDLFKVKGIKRYKTWALVLSSILFGLVHLPKGWNYCLLAIIAGFAYGILFLKGRNMFGPMMLHMTVDVVAAKFFGAQL